MRSASVRCSFVAVALTFAMGFEVANAQIGSADEIRAPSAFSQTPMGQVVSGLNPMNWKMPQMKMPSIRNIMPNKEEKMRITDKKNGLMTEIGETTKRSWTRTKQTLNPMRLVPKGMFGGGESKQAAKPQVKKAGFFESLLGPKQPEVQQSSVNDFLRQDKPIR